MRPIQKRLLFFLLGLGLAFLFGAVSLRNSTAPTDEKSTSQRFIEEEEEIVEEK